MDYPPLDKHKNNYSPNNLHTLLKFSDLFMKKFHGLTSQICHQPDELSWLRFCSNIRTGNAY